MEEKSNLPDQKDLNTATQLIQPVKSHKKRNIFLIVIIVLVIGGLAAAGYFGYRYYKKQQQIKHNKAVEQEKSIERAVPVF
jgi:predicted negative regulator of RcsB-dependent stress response